VISVFLITLFVPIQTSLLAADQVFDRFISNYCFECHDSDIQKGERNFESFALPLKNKMDLITAKEIIDQITLKEMPPKKSDQPSDEERLAVIEALRKSIQDARSQFTQNAGRTIMRRLSKREYLITLESLFGRRLDTLGLGEEFPKENTSEHMDNIGQSLITSGFLLDQYFQAADRLVELRLNRPKIKPQSWHFKDNFKQYEELSGSHKAAFKYRYLCLYEQPNTDTRQGGYGHIEDFLDGVPVSGLYKIEVLAQAMHRDTHYDPKILGMDFSEPFLLGIVPGDVRKGHIHYPQRIEPQLAKPLVLPDQQPEWQTFTVWLEANQTPRFIFPNGAYESRASVLQLNKRYKDELKLKKVSVGRTALLRNGKLPHIRISEIKIHGPLEEPGGSKEEISIFGNTGFQKDKALEQLLDFAKRAYRRPLTKEDQEHIQQTYQTALKSGGKARLAALDTIKMMLCSPSFLYLSEITPEKENRLRPFDLASRLSYALWSSPPDDELMHVAANGTLVKDEVLLKQLQRLLADPRSQNFVKGFLDSWLNLRELGHQPPSRNSARAYYAEDLPTSMKKETHLFFSHLLHENKAIENFLDADYTFVDKKLAKLYNLPQIDKLRLADGFQKVPLKGNDKRGGLLGMASVLTVSANGVDTSPVTRGVWVAHNILGTPPPPPPDEVPAIDTDVSGAITIREKLKAHRNSKTCASCHQRIDPLGFPLETFDPIGRWRKHYPSPKKKSAAAVDPSGELASGESFNNFSEFKKVLKQYRQAPFTRHLITQILTYATGRHMEIIDQYEIDDIQKQLSKQNNGLRSLVTLCLTSDIFRTR
jgi:hypothetical protein